MTPEQDFIDKLVISQEGIEDILCSVHIIKGLISLTVDNAKTTEGTIDRLRLMDSQIDRIRKYFDRGAKDNGKW